MNKKSIHKKMLCIALAILTMVANIYYAPKKVNAAPSYYIKVNRATNVVTIYNNSDNTPVTAFTCSTGGKNTPLGTYTTSDTYVWHTLVGPSYGQYCVRITGGILFHSVWYYTNKDKASMSNEEFNKLGTSASHGCIRLQLKDTKWIYDNCGSGTKVIIFDGSESDDPLGKPEVIKIQSKEKMGWDPTDPDASNPYNKCKPSFTITNVKKKLNIGDTWSALDGVTAKDSLGGDITSSIKYYGNVDTSKPGNYKIIYQVTDLLGRSKSYAITFTVIDHRKASISGVHGKQTKEINTKYNVKDGITAKTATGKNITSKIYVEVQSPSDTAPVHFKGKVLKLNEIGTYTITYSVTSPDNNKITKKKTVIKVKDNRKAKITGVAKKATAEYNSKYELKKNITAYSSYGKNISSKIKVEVQMPDSEYPVHFKGKSLKLTQLGTYYIVYSVQNPANGKECKKILALTSADTKAPVIKGVTTGKTMVAYNTKVNLTEGISANLLSGKDVTERIKIYIKTPANSDYVEMNTAELLQYPLNIMGTYKIKYICDNPQSGAIAEKKCSYVAADMKKPILNVTSKQTVSIDTTVNLLNRISAKYAIKGTSLDSKIKVSIQISDSDEYIAINTSTAKNYNFASAGTYKVKYSVTNPNNAQATTQKAVIFNVTE